MEQVFLISCIFLMKRVLSLINNYAIFVPFSFLRQFFAKFVPVISHEIHPIVDPMDLSPPQVIFMTLFIFIILLSNEIFILAQSKTGVAIDTGLLYVIFLIFLGDMVNIASRIETITKHLGDQQSSCVSLCSAELIQAAQWDKGQSTGLHKLPGIDTEYELFRI